MFTYSTACQATASVSTPPRMAPAAPPLPATAPQMPSALFRSGPSANSVITSARAAGETSAAPSPWVPRAMTSHSADCARAPASEAAVNSTSPAMNMRRRPIRSAIRPPSSRKPPNSSA
jgi:hypothetical protein